MLRSPRSFIALATALAFSAPGAALSQDIDAEIEAALAAEPAEPAPESAPPEAAAPAAAKDLPQIGEDQLAVFVLQRGFYSAADLGVFLTFSGTRGYSNVQPYVSLKAGFDIGDNLSLQASLAAGYSSGNPTSDNDNPKSAAYSSGQMVVNYGLFMLGADVVGALRPTPRFAIEPKLGGGLTLISPQPSDPNDPSVGISNKAPYVSGGVDLEYLTLLTDFSAGASFTGYYVLGPNIPGLGIAFTVRYTF